MLGLEPALDLAGSKYLADVHGLRKALKGVPPKIALIEERTHQPVCDWRNDKGIGLGDRLQARNQVRGLADRGVLLGNALANEIANDNHAGADGNAGLHRHM